METVLAIESYTQADNRGYQCKLQYSEVCSPVIRGWGDQCAGSVLCSGDWRHSKQTAGRAAGGSRLKLIWGQLFIFISDGHEGRSTSREWIIDEKLQGFKMRRSSNFQCVFCCLMRSVFGINTDSVGTCITHRNKSLILMRQNVVSWVQVEVKD